MAWGESGKLGWTEMLAKFYESFAVWVKEAKCYGAPEHEKAIAVIEKLATIKKWEEPVKVGRKTYDDLNFFNSVKDKYSETQVLTAKQWGVLLRLGTKYIDQLPEKPPTKASLIQKKPKRFYYARLSR